MRIRSTKPEFWKSRRIASVSWDARLVLKGLESYVDDNGVGVDDIELIVSDVFPRDMFANGRETVARVSEAITELHQAGLVHRYSTDADRLLYISWWEEVQRIDKPGKGRKPRPDGSLNYKDSVIRESVARVPERVAPGTGEQGNRGTEEQGNNSCSPAAPSSVIEASNRFDEFWKAYPRKVGKQKAVAKYKAAVKRAESEQQIIDGAQRLRDDPNREDQYTPHPTTWLERNGWEDPELPQRTTTGSEARLQKAAAWIGYDQAPPPEPDWSYGEFQSGAFLGEIEG